jgi:esterase/lipase
MFQSIANETGGTRAAGYLGYTRSMKYVAKQLKKVGYDVHFTNVSAG